jgi:hypothetical protein
VLTRSKRTQYLGEAMTAVCELMRSYGISKEAAENEFHVALKRGYSVGQMRPSRQVRPITRLADVWGRWYIDKKYVNKRGEPKPLTWNGQSGSLLTLARQVVGVKSAREVIAEMFSRKLLRKTKPGVYVPKSKVVTPSGIDTAQIRRTATMMGHLLRTVAYNSNLRYRGDVLLEVMAQVPRLPGRDISRFRKFSKAQGLMFARTVDDWLESRNQRRRARPRVPTREVGIVAFAFEQTGDS